MRKPDIGGKAQILGKMRKGNGMWKEPCEFRQGPDELTMCKSKNSLATRNDRLAIYYEAKSGRRGASMTRGKHKSVATTYATASSKDKLCLQSLLSTEGLALLLTQDILHLPIPLLFHF